MPGNSNSLNTRVNAMAPDASTSPVEWGPEIRVGNCKPEGLVKDSSLVWWTDGEVSHVSTTERLVWTQERVPLKAIRLPAGHPYYSKAPTTPERDPALWDRMVALVRDIAEVGGEWTHGYDQWKEAKTIVADLPKPVDPDLIEARRIVSDRGYPSDYEEVDDDSVVGVALAAIKRGRELAGEQA